MNNISRTETTGNLVITLRILIVFSVVCVVSFMVNHTLVSTLSNEADRSSKIGVTNSLERFKNNMIDNPIVHGIELEIKKDLERVWDEIKPKPIQRPDYKTDLDSTSSEHIVDQHFENPPPVVVVDSSHTALPVDHLHEHDTLAIPIEKGFHSLQCPHSELMEFWKPVTAEDTAYKSPYAEEGADTKYVIFEPDEGGWNNIRMQMELVLVFAYATGRTLVLPPDQPMYLLNKGKGHQKEHSFADFFPFDYIRQRLPVISMEQFLRVEGVAGRLRNQETGVVQYPPQNKTTFDTSGKRVRLVMWHYIRNVSACPDWKAMKEFVVIPPAPGMNVSLLPPVKARPYQDKLDVFAAKRSPKYYDRQWHGQKIVHFITDPETDHRLLEHFYTFIHFQSDEQDRFYKRFVRDYIHYVDAIFCKGAAIISQLLEQGGGRYAAFHIRRGDFQYKSIKIPAAQMLQNVGHHISNDSLVFIATDERNRSFFDAFHQRYKKVLYLNDFIESAGLQDINPNYLGMIDQVICSRGELFVGTWFSTFSGYITRMRGYLGYHDYSVFYGDKDHMDRFQYDELPKFPFYMREWNVSWANIDEL